MNIKNNFELRNSQIQKFTLSSKLEKSLNILKMNNFELTDYINNESLENPLIEIVDVSTDDFDFYSNKTSFNSLENKLEWENTYSENLTLINFLLDQIILLNLNPSEKRALKFLIYSLNEKGFLDIPIEELSVIGNFDLEFLKKAFEILRTLDPIGVGAVSLEDCLNMQLQQSQNDDHITINIVNNYLDLVKKGSLATISEKLKVHLSKVEKSVKKIKLLSPNISSGFANNSYSDTSFIKPDVIIKNQNNKIEVVFNKNSIPNIKINYEYESLTNSNDPKVIEYLKKSVEKAEDLIFSINKRTSTLIKIVNEIIFFQNDFFLNNRKGSLKSLLVKDLAKKLSLNSSTISRTVNGKFLEFDKKIIPLKIFIVNKIENNEVENNDIYIEIKNLIYEEDKKVPLSDQSLSDILNKKGFQISRRTVAKYRDLLNILPSKSRKIV